MAGDSKEASSEGFKVLTEEEIEKLTPDERTKYDEFMREKEKKEQEALPYRWTQTLYDVEVTVPLPNGTRSKDLDVVIEKNRLKVAIKGQPAIMEGKMHADIKLEESTWHLDSDTLVLSLSKLKSMEWWKNVLTHHPPVDTTKIQPENSKLSDLDGDVRAMVEKMMYDQSQKAQNKPTSAEMRNRELLKNFQAKHPELDLSSIKNM